jgi:hypothetical protein
MSSHLANDLVSAARELLRFRPGNTGPDSWTQFEGADTDWDAMADATWARFAQAVTTHAASSERRVFAAMMAQAILTGAVTRGCPSNEWIDQSMAVKCADALLTALKEVQK